MFFTLDISEALITNIRVGLVELNNAFILIAYFTHSKASF